MAPRRRGVPPPPPRGQRKATIRQSLASLDIHDATVFEECDGSREEEFKVIKKCYFKRILSCHPDKGGDPAVFRTVQTSFELLRDLHGQRKSRKHHKGDDWLFASCLMGGVASSRKKKAATARRTTTTAAGTEESSSSEDEDDDDDDDDDDEYKEQDEDQHDDDDDNDDDDDDGEEEDEDEENEDEYDDDEEEEEFDMSGYEEYFSNMETPSWEYYAEAAEEAVPLYRVELAKSNRSKCTQKGIKAKRCHHLHHPNHTEERQDDAKEEGDATTENDQENHPPTKKNQRYTTRNNNHSTTASLVVVKSTNNHDDSSSIPPPETIRLGEIRIGWINEQSGTYGGWVHLRCWRVPYKVWLGLPDPEHCHDRSQFENALNGMNDMVLCGFVELPPQQKNHVVCYVMNKENWTARRRRRQPQPQPQPQPQLQPQTKNAVGEKNPSSANNRQSDSKDSIIIKHKKKKKGTAAATTMSTTTSAATTVVSQPQKKRQRFVIPQPNTNGSSPANALEGTTFVLTGVFPEVGGGMGLSLGKGRVKAMIESFGGRVTSAVSGKTNVLVVGKEPGFSKVSKARSSNKRISMVTVRDVKQGLDGGCLTWKEFPVVSKKKEKPMLIQDFSKGYKYRNGGHYNSLAMQASKHELAIAQGIIRHDDCVAAKSNSEKINKKNKKQNVLLLEGDDDIDKNAKKRKTVPGTKSRVEDTTTRIKKRIKKSVPNKKETTTTKKKISQGTKTRAAALIKNEDVVLEENKPEGAATASNIVLVAVKKEESTTTKKKSNISTGMMTTTVSVRTRRVTRSNSSSKE